MANIEMTLTADGKEKKGTLVPEVGGTLKLSAADADATLGIDYTSPDKLIIKGEGELKLVKDKVTVGGEVDENLFNGDASVKGEVAWAIDKNVKVGCDVGYGSDGPTAGASLTLKF